MAHVVVQVNGRGYTMQCNDGEESHVAELAELLDTEIERIKHAVGQVGDIRLLLMAGLVIADKLSEALKRVEELDEQVRTMQASRNGAVRQGQELEEAVAQRLDAAARRLEALARDGAKGTAQAKQTEGAT